MAATFSVRKYRNGTNELAVKTRCLSTRREKKTNKNKQKQHFAWRPRKFCVGEKNENVYGVCVRIIFFFYFTFLLLNVTNAITPVDIQVTTLN